MLQTRIDQFYKSVSGKHITDVENVKKHSRSKSISHPKSKRENKNVRKRDSLSQHNIESDKLNCEIIYEKNNKTMNYNVSLDEKDYLENTSQNMFDRTHQLKRKILNNNENLNFNERTSIINNHTDLNKTPDNSPVKARDAYDDDNHLKKSSNKKLKTPDKNNFSFGNSNNSFSTPKKLNYASKVPSGKSPRTITRKKLFGETIDTDIITRTIENMNLAKQGAIPLHNFDLEEIYSRTTFDYQYSNINTKTSMKYELNDINLCDDLNSKILLATIFSVFSNPVNCGYFDENELDFVYSIITLPINAQMLLARIIKRKRGWFRKSNINYPEIAEDLKDIFKVLVSRSICKFDIKNENLLTILELLKVDEIHRICQKLKLNSKKNKQSNIQKLLKLSKYKPLFPGANDPSSSLYASIFDILDYCVSITTKTWDIIDRIITLLIPNQDPKSSIADTFRMLCDIYLGKTIFPNISGCCFPVFSSKSHLMSYIEARSTLSTILQYIEQKNWKKVQNYGNLAMDVLPNILETESLRLKNSLLPIHVRRYMRGYTWLKVLDACIDAFKKDNDKKRVVEVLTLLINQECHMHEKKGKWYAELALIEMHHRKNIEESASIVVRALNKENLTQVDKVNIMERANKILKKKTKVALIMKATISKMLEDYIHFMPKYEAAYTTINAELKPGNTSGNKSIWCIKSSTDSQSYGSVETLAFHHYREQGFPSGLHCEGALPIILFFSMFWEELYMSIPGAFVTLYQDAPADLFTEQFYENRKEKIDMKLQIIGEFNSESLSCYMEDKFKVCKQYQSVMSSNLQMDNLQLKEIIHCLGVEGVVGICKRLISSFKLWKAGFPDLIVWNYHTKQHKIVEVKGPRDTLSTKQRLWLEYLHQLGLNTEVCLVQDKFTMKKQS